MADNGNIWNCESPLNNANQRESDKKKEQLTNRQECLNRAWSNPLPFAESASQVCGAVQAVQTFQ